MSKKIILLLLSSIVFTASSFAESYVVSNSNPHIVESYSGVIVDKRWVQYDRYVGDNEGLGTVAGAVTGGVVGSAFGGGSGRIVGVIGGTVIGGLLGNSIGRSTPEYKRNYMLEYTFRVNDGSLMTVLQNSHVNLFIGQKVQLERSNDGRWFLIPASM